MWTHSHVTKQWLWLHCLFLATCWVFWMVLDTTCSCFPCLLSSIWPWLGILPISNPSKSTYLALPILRTFKIWMREVKGRGRWAGRQDLGTSLLARRSLVPFHLCTGPSCPAGKWGTIAREMAPLDPSCRQRSESPLRIILLDVACSPGPESSHEFCSEMSCLCDYWYSLKTMVDSRAARCHSLIHILKDFSFVSSVNQVMLVSCFQNPMFCSLEWYGVFVCIFCKPSSLYSAVLPLSYPKHSNVDLTTLPTDSLGF